ncbi:hypothetical protein VTN77DRAFT_4439 [Rasamsonia byssochlamydoides]|uniref:uncharacterized protein n=1 Tax=Rasamsonia byssochlamydoides TaxID=89139 RepID=UPI003742325D
MLPNFLFGSYKRYKADTDLFTAWLVETATKAAFTGSPWQSLLASLGLLQRRLSHFHHITDVARRAISTRKRCAAWFQNQTDARQANSAHSHFINVLEEALALLGVADREIHLEHPEPHPQPGRNPSPPGQNPLIDLENRFSALEVEECRTSNENVHQSGPKPQKTPPLQRYEIDDQFENDWVEIFASFCLLEDMQRIRDFLQATWVEYREAQIDLITAAVTTNTAFDLVRITCDEFMDDYPSLRGTMDLSQLMYNTGCFMRGADPAKKQHPEDPFNIAVADIVEWCLVQTTLILESFTRVIIPDSVPWFKKDYYQSSLFGGRPSHYVYFVFLERFQIKLLVEDEFTRGVRDMVKTKHVPVWLAFAAQVILDTHRILGPNVSQPFQELRLTGLRTKKTLEEDMRQFSDIVYRTITDDMFDIAPKEAPRDEEFSFLKTYPILCGLLMFSINLKMQQMGISYVNPAPLYWEDMEKVIDFHDENHISMGGKPKDAHDTYKKLWLVMGFAPSSFASKGRKRPTDMALKKVAPRVLKSASVVAAVFQDRYCGGGSIDLSVHNVGQLLKDLTGNHHGTAKVCRSEALILRRKWTVSNNLSPLQLLTALRERLADEELKLLFNYFGLQDRCLDLLQALREELNDKLVQYFGPTYLKDEKDLTLIVNYILDVAHGSAASAQSLGLAKGSARVMSKMVMRAANVIQSFVKGKGGVGCKELRAFCRQKSKVMSQEAGKSESESEQKTLYWFAVDELVDPKDMIMLELMLSASLQNECFK